MQPRCLLSVLVCFSALTPQAFAQRDLLIESGGKRIALVMGNDSYPQWPLKAAVNDARAIAKELRATGFDVTLATDVSLRNFGSAIDKFVGQLGAGDVALFYYAGHGLQIEGENYLVPVDFQAQDEAEAKYLAYSASRLADRMEQTGARLKIVILDACRTNPFKRTRAVSGGLAQMNAGRGSFIAFATSPGRVAVENPRSGNGLFTEHLIRELRQPGLTLNELFDGVRQSVDSDSQGQQLPWTSSSVIGSFVFRPGVNPSSSGLSTSEATEIIYWNSIQGSSNRKVFESYLEKYPQGQFVKLARLKLEELTPPTAPKTTPVVGQSPDFVEGERLYKSKQYAAALPALRSAAASGNSAAMDYLGVMYHAGEGVAKDDPEAARWYRKASDLGNGSATNHLAVFYEKGWGVAPNMAEAIRLYRKAMQEGNNFAPGNLGRLYSTGVGVDRDDAQALHYFRAAAEAQLPAAMTSVGLFYKEGRGGLTKDDTLAAKWFHDGAMAGDGRAMAELGLLYQNGSGVAKDLIEALRWFRKGAEAGNRMAFNQIGFFYRNAMGVERDYEEAARWFRKGMELGNPASMSNLASMYERGLGVPQDQVEALRLYRKAAALGDDFSKKRLTELDPNRK